MHRKLIKLALPTIVAVAMVAMFMLVGGLGFLPSNTAHAAPATSITSISVNSTCGTAGGFTGTVTLNGTSSGTITLGLFYHVPGNSTFIDSGLRATATFTGGSTATYNFASFTFPGANTYRIQVIDSGGLGGATVKSNSVQPCTPGTTTTATPTSPPPTKTTATPTIGKTTTTTGTATG
jgi:hypothetical protein